MSTYKVITDLAYAKTNIFNTDSKTEASDHFSRMAAQAQERGGMVSMRVNDKHQTTAIFNRDGSSKWQYGSKLEWHHKAS